MEIHAHGDISVNVEVEDPVRRHILRARQGEHIFRVERTNFHSRLSQTQDRPMLLPYVAPKKKDYLSDLSLDTPHFPNIFHHLINRIRCYIGKNMKVVS